MQKLKYPHKLAILLSWIVAISLYSVTPTFAKDRSGAVPTTSGPKTHSRFIPDDNQKLRIVGVKVFSPDGKELTAKLSPEAREKITGALTKSLAEGRCTMNLVEDGVGSCFGNCLKSAGVSPMQLVLCGTSCALWETGVGLIVCAVCVGMDATAVMFCATGCSFYAS